MARRKPATPRVNKASRGKAPGVTLTPADRTALYAARRFIGTSVENKLKLRIPFDVYFQDPLVAAANPKLAFDEDFSVPWEPGFGDGPTSARFAVVDYDGHTETLAAPARWDKTRDTFLAPDGTPLDRFNTGHPQFHQVNVWAIVQRALDFFESGFGLGRRVPWGFEGNRLIVVPHAGPGENAYYDRHSKSLQFYYFDRGDERIQTCLSTDIINHEFGHALLDGIRPLYIEADHAGNSGVPRVHGRSHGDPDRAAQHALPPAAHRRHPRRSRSRQRAVTRRRAVRPARAGPAVPAQRHQQAHHGGRRRRSAPALHVAGPDRRDVRHHHPAVATLRRHARAHGAPGVLGHDPAHAAHGDPAAGPAAAGRRHVQRLRPRRAAGRGDCQPGGPRRLPRHDARGVHQARHPRRVRRDGDCARGTMSSSASIWTSSTTSTRSPARGPMPTGSWTTTGTGSSFPRTPTSSSRTCARPRN